MQLVVPDLGEKFLVLQMLREDASALPLRLRLFKNDIGIGSGTVIGDMVDADFDGYAQVDLDPALWTDPITIGGRAQSQYATAAQSWTNEGVTGQTVYGYYVCDYAGTVLLWGAPFDDPITVAPAGTLEVWPVMTMKSEY